MTKGLRTGVCLVESPLLTFYFILKIDLRSLDKLDSSYSMSIFLFVKFNNGCFFGYYFGVSTF